MFKNKPVLAFSCLSVLILLFSLYVFWQKEGRSLLKPSRVKNIVIYPDTEEYKKIPIDLVIYFHGSNCDESWVFTSFAAGGLNLIEDQNGNFKRVNNGYRENLVFASLGYDTRFHWSSPDVAKDSIKEIKKLIKNYKVNKIILIGVSAGGSLALNFLSLADKEIQDLTTDVVSVFPIIDYEYTYRHTKRENILSYLTEHFSKYKDQLQAMKLSSPITYISKVPVHTKIILIEGTQDTHVCSNQIEKYHNELIKSGRNSELIKYNVDHLLVDLNKEFGELIKSLLS